MNGMPALFMCAGSDDGSAISACLRVKKMYVWEWRWNGDFLNSLQKGRRDLSSTAAHASEMCTTHTRRVRIASPAGP